VGIRNAASYQHCLLGVDAMSNRYLGIETRRVKTETQKIPPVQKLGVSGWMSLLLAAALLGGACAVLWDQLS